MDKNDGVRASSCQQGFGWLNPARSRSPHRVVVIAYDRLCTFEFGVAVEIFGLPRPEMGEDWYRFAVAAAEPGMLRAVGGVRLAVDGGLELLTEADTIIIPGWRDDAEPPPAEMIAALRDAHARGARLMSICSGVFVIAATGLLAGRRAATHWRYADQLARAFPDIEVDPDVLYVDEGDILTSAGSAAGMDLGLHLVRTDFGPEAANLVARRLVMSPHREGGQAQFVERPIPPAREGSRLGPIFDRMRERLHGPQSIPSLAVEVGMSERTFLRRFKAATGCTPSVWILQQRLVLAKDLLETTARSIDDVAASCGLGTAENLRNHFRRQFRCSPSEHRRLFRRTPAKAPAAPA